MSNHVFPEGQTAILHSLDPSFSLLLVHPPAVKSIKKQHLVEVRSLTNPPKTVKMTMESICLLLGEPATDWKSLRQIIMRDNFIPNIIKFSTEDITDHAREKLTRDYMSDPSYNFESVNHASKACGPLVKWAIAQVCVCVWKWCLKLIVLGS